MRKFKLVVLFIGLGLFLVAPAVSAKNWSVPKHFPTIQDAIDSPAVKDGDTILVGPGNFAGALVSKRVEIKGIGGATIDGGPAHGSGLIQGFRLRSGSAGSTISHLTFKVDLAIMNGDGVGDVTLAHNRFLSAIQAVSNWRGNAWTISHNTITDLRTKKGGGIGILIADFTGGYVEDNVVEHNTVSGVLTSEPGEGGGYNGSGIVLFADYRWGRKGAQRISFNRVVKNKVSLVSKADAGIDVAAFEMTDTRDDGTLPPVIVQNAIGYNDFRGTTLQIVLTPANLDISNSISRNFGENRGKGLHPSIFKP